MSLPEPAQSPPRRLAAGKPQLHQRRSLEQANQVSLQIAGNQVAQSADPQGQHLRQIRKAQGLDPSRVATEACISLGQLYELETGGRRLFYSETLRQQAGRRVALMLGCDWEALSPMPATSPSGPGASIPSDQTSSAAPSAGETSVTTETRAPDPPAAAPMQAPAQTVVSSPAAAGSAHGPAQAPEHALEPLPDGTPGPAHQSTKTGSERSVRAEAVLRAAVWGLLGVVLVLAAARAGWMPGIRLPL